MTVSERFRRLLQVVRDNPGTSIPIAIGSILLAYGILVISHMSPVDMSMGVTVAAVGFPLSS